MTEQLQEEKGYNTIAGYRSAISAFHYQLDGCRVRVHPTVSALMKWIFNKKPPKPKYTLIWNVDFNILGYLKTLMLDNKNLGKLSHELVMLLALTSASEIWQLDINYMVKTDSFYRFTLAKPIKVQKPGQPHIKLEFLRFDDNPSMSIGFWMNTLNSLNLLEGRSLIC